jgi:hypothetical protein
MTHGHNSETESTSFPRVENYCKLVAEAAPLIRKADPSGILLAPATSGIPFDGLENCFKQGLLQWIDALSVHPYRPQAPETVVKDYDRLRKLLTQYTAQGKQIPLPSFPGDSCRYAGPKQACLLASGPIEAGRLRQSTVSAPRGLSGQGEECPSTKYLYDRESGTMIVPQCKRRKQDAVAARRRAAVILS